MSINDTDIVWRKAAVSVGDTGSNGGRMTATVIPSGTKNNIWPDVPQAERTAGSLKYRKVFIHIANDDDLTLIRPRIFVETATPGDDNITVFPGTFTDTQSAISGSERLYGGGSLNANTSIGATVLTVQTEGAALGCFQDGDLVRVSDKATVSSVVGNEEYVTIASSGVSYSGAVATLTITTPLSYAYSATNTRVSSVYEPADVVGFAENHQVTTVGSGDYNFGTSPVLVDSIGGIYQTWTLTFTSATAFNIAGDDLGTLSGVTGNKSSSFAPTNTALSKPYFTLSSSGYSGTYQAGDTIVFRTVPAAIPLWYRRSIPAGASSLSGNKVIIGIDGESA